MAAHKTLAKYMSEANKIGKCIVHSSRQCAKHVYELRHGKVSKGLHVCHTCIHRSCIRDSHMFLGNKYKDARHREYYSIADYESRAKFVGECLVYPAKGSVARKIYQLRHGKLPSHLLVCHICDNPPCILDAHHFVGTNADNMADAVKKNRFKTGKAALPGAYEARCKKSAKLWRSKSYRTKTVAGIRLAKEKQAEGVRLAWRDGVYENVKRDKGGHFTK